MFSILIFIACSVMLHANDNPILGQSPRSAIICKQSSTDYFVSGSFMPSTVLPYSTINEFGKSIQVDEELAKIIAIGIGTSYHFNKNVEILFSVGAQFNAGQFYVPIHMESRISPMNTKIRPFLAMGFGGIMSREFGLYSVRGIGLSTNISKQITFDIHYRQIRGYIFALESEHQTQWKLNQNGVQLSSILEL